MRFGFASLLVWIVWLLAINLLSRYGGTAVAVATVLINLFPLACAASIVCAILAGFWHSKWWGLSALVALWATYEWWLG